MSYLVFLLPRLIWILNFQKNKKEKKANYIRISYQCNVKVKSKELLIWQRYASSRFTFSSSRHLLQPRWKLVITIKVINERISQSLQRIEILPLGSYVFTFYRNTQFIISRGNYEVRKIYNYSWFKRNGSWVHTFPSMVWIITTEHTNCKLSKIRTQLSGSWCAEDRQSYVM